MNVWTALDEVPGAQRSVVAIGNFDGVHRGHARLLGVCVERARVLGASSVALTFDPHPRAVHDPLNAPALISPLEDRLANLAVTGLDATLVAKYDRSLYLLSPEEFVSEYLVDRLGAVEVVVGEDFRFGYQNSGNIDTLRRLGRVFGFDVITVSDIEDPSGRRWSSSWVRELLDAGDVEGAARVLGRAPRYCGVVEHGQKRGRQLGFPTANLHWDQSILVPADGVYAGWLIREVAGGQAFLPAAISIGTNPQFSGKHRTIEAHVLGRSDLDLYGETVTLVFEKRLRGMARFASVDDLLKQMDEDLRRTAEALGVKTAGRVAPDSVVAGI